VCCRTQVGGGHRAGSGSKPTPALASAGDHTGPLPCWAAAYLAVAVARVPGETLRGGSPPGSLSDHGNRDTFSDWKDATCDLVSLLCTCIISYHRVQTLTHAQVCSATHMQMSESLCLSRFLSLCLSLSHSLSLSFGISP
jgi:hypothetical protein